MGNLAIHMRITGIDVTDNIVDTRNSAVDDLVTTWGKIKSTREILIKVAQIAQTLGVDGTPEAELSEEVEAAIQKHASAFLASESQLEVGICAGVAMINLISGPPDVSGWTIPDIFAMALWSALEFQSPLDEVKRENLRQELLTLARRRASTAGDVSRTRSEVTDFVELTINQTEDRKISNNFRKATSATISALRRNAALDREELDFLWWVQLNRSRLLNRSLNSISEPVRLVVTGIEAAEFLRRCPAQVHREIVLRSLDENPTLDLKALLVLAGQDLAAIIEDQQSAAIAWAPLVFPLLHSLKTGLTDVNGGSVVRPSSDWGTRALLEASLAKLAITGMGAL